MSETPYIVSVREQYEDLPYPPRDPEDEKKRILSPLTACLDRITHWGFGGKRDLRDGCRILVAGGGTGDGVIFFAEQLRGFNAEIVYVDISTASLSIAKKRAEIRKLSNISWIHDSILNIPQLGLGTFDFIDCSGVLHHLASPDAGLQALAAVLADDGIVCPMVYGLYGRTAVYQMQALMRTLVTPEDSRQTKLELTRKVFSALPPTHWVNKSRHAAINIANTDDTELYDLILHSQDRAYTIPDVYSLVEGAGLKIVTFFASHEAQGNFLYDPSAYTNDPKLLERIQKLDIKSQQAVCELMNGNISRHSFYAARNVPRIPLQTEDHWLPFIWMVYGEAGYQKIRTETANAATGKVVTLTDAYSEGAVGFVKSIYSQAIVDALDGKNTIGGILASAQQKHHTASPQDIRSAFNAIFNTLHVHNRVLLRDPRIKPFLSGAELQSRLGAITGEASS